MTAEPSRHHRCSRDVVRRQVEAGIDVVSDGEMSKISYATYIKDRLTGFDGDSPREPGQDLVEFPRYWRSWPKLGATAKYRRPRCMAAISVKSMEPMRADIANMKAAIAAAKPAEGFINAASPGTIALFQPNEYYKSQDEYLEAVAEAMRAEYEGIVGGGTAAADRCAGHGHGPAHDVSRSHHEEFLRLAELHIEVLNHALRNVPADRVRMHVCWGNYEGPHTHDVPLEKLLPVVLKAKPQAMLIEAANPRHAHEWQVFRDQANFPTTRSWFLACSARPPITSSTRRWWRNASERFADIVGRERVHRRHRLRLRHLRRLRASGSGHRVAEAEVAGGRRSDRVQTALGQE